VLLLFRRSPRDALRAGAVAVLIVSPLIVFTWLYYGTVIPHGLGTKTQHYTVLSSLTIGNTGLLPAWLAQRLEVMLPGTVRQLSPFFEAGAVSSAPLAPKLAEAFAVLLLILAAVGGWYKRAVLGWGAVSLYAALYMTYRILFLPEDYYGWYIVPFAAVAALLAAAGLTAMSRRYPLLVPPLATLLILGFTVPTLWIMPLEGQVQSKVENRVRRPVGEWLSQNVEPRQTVVSESAGYVGWYGNFDLYDYPGLTSETSAAALRKALPGEASISYLVNATQPDWIVLRPFELAQLEALYPKQAANYSVVKSFTTDAQLRYGPVSFVSLDKSFLVLRRSQTGSTVR
jgi:hypothetical protein